MLPENLVLRQFESGPLDNFLYIVGDSSTNEGAIVDPAWDVPRIVKEVEDTGLNITSIYITHTHPDHINALEEILTHYKVPIYVHAAEYDVIAAEGREMYRTGDADMLSFGNVSFEVLHTPGHSPGHVSFLYENVLLAGDCIFVDGCGRCDLPGSDPKVQYHSLYEVIAKLPDNTIIYPGHNYGPTPYATVGEQKETNPYLKCNSEEEFLTQRMGITS